MDSAVGGSGLEAAGLANEEHQGNCQEETVAGRSETTKVERYGGQCKFRHICTPPTSSSLAPPTAKIVQPYQHAALSLLTTTS